MDANNLLQELHFQLSKSSCCSKEGGLCENNKYYVEEKVKWTEKWVTNVQLRKRARSTDSYFRPPSVCDQLKKSFLKPSNVTEEDLEDLQNKLSLINIRGSEDGSASGKMCLDKQLFQPFAGHEQCAKPPTLRKRSRTISLIFPQYDLQSTSSIKNPANHNLDENSNEVADPLTDNRENGEPSHQYYSEVCNCAQECDFKESFRTENLIPTREDLFKKPLLKILPNKIIGSFNNVNEYLKTHFYLLREDFLAPLREGIADYQDKLRRGIPLNEVKNMKLYHKVSLGEACVHQNQLGIRVQMQRWCHERVGEKDFMFGSMVLLTESDFSDAIIGTVLHHESAEKKLNMQPRNGSLIITLHGSSHFDPCLKQKKFTLAEPKAFFQTYYHVMKAFQCMKDKDFPMKEFIIYSQSSPVVRPPQYLNKDAQYSLGDRSVKVLDYSSWPERDLLEVNESQLEAFKKALTEKLVIIQGPPGTGKTYLGCKVAKALLSNSHVWNKNRNRPMLLVCQTNHALDQFMEKLIPISSKIIRVGSQSKSEKLMPFNLREFQLKAQGGLLGKDCKSILSRIRRNLPNLKFMTEEIQSCVWEIKRVCSHGILSLGSLIEADVIEPKYKSCFSSSKDFQFWLEEAKDFQVKQTAGDQIHLVDDAVAAELMQRKCSYDHSEKSRVVIPNSSTSCKSMSPDMNSVENVEKFSIMYYVTFDELKTTLKRRRQLNELWAKGGVRDWTVHETEQQINYYLAFLRLRLAEWQSYNGESTDWCVVDCLWNLPPNLRWKLYRVWLNRFLSKLQHHLTGLEDEFVRVSTIYQELALREKLEVMRHVDLVGMTSSAAARLYPILQDLGCPIVIVEEAAEVLESHIIAAVTKHCQHLILLGDHKQLRPRPASYSLSKLYFTDVSLFERLLLNNTVAVNTLLTQHRMRPEVSALIRPSVYPKLLDHACTKYRPSVRGVQKNVFFFSHRWQEKKNPVTGSYSNPSEAEMAVRLVCYLLKQNYCAKDICVLTTYHQQVIELQERRNIYPDLKDVRMETVDKFQGEESHIVVLSLVRNNPRGQIGFLAVENRTCVALSRARDGLYMLGNLQLLSSKSSLWSFVRTVLASKDSAGMCLPLECKRHPRNLPMVSHPDDFFQYSEGGCNIPCMTTLSCGHVCPRICHPDDFLHLEYRCCEPCEKFCPFGHQCPKLCHDQCGNCEHEVCKVLSCGHAVLVECSFDISQYLCKFKVTKQMKPCHHVVKVYCWMPPISDEYCTEPCKIRLDCGHVCPLSCHPDRPDHDEVFCETVVTTVLPCGHNFIGECGFRTEPCKEKVLKTLPCCGHVVNFECGLEPSHEKCSEPCEKLLLCGHRCKNKCSQPCQQVCDELVYDSVPLDLCGHYPIVQCSERNCLLKDQSPMAKFCRNPCVKILKCGHQCTGLCGECRQAKLHRPCRQHCEHKLMCGHVCEAMCSISCPPCPKYCEASCDHSKCRQLCGEPCIPCLEKCVRQCRHHACSRLCSEFCDVEPCLERCDQMLQCGHICIGYCGEPCPSLCSVCDPSIEAFSDVRPVFLKDCKCTVVPKELEEALKSCSKRAFMSFPSVPKEVYVPECPLCHTAVRNTLRYRVLFWQYKKYEREVHLSLVRRVSVMLEQVISLKREIQHEINHEYIRERDDFSTLHEKLRTLLTCAAKSNMHSLSLENVYFIASRYLIALKCFNFLSKSSEKHKPSEMASDLVKALFILTQFTDLPLCEQQVEDVQKLASQLTSICPTVVWSVSFTAQLIGMREGCWFICQEGHVFAWMNESILNSVILPANLCCRHTWKAVTRKKMEEKEC